MTRPRILYLSSSWPRGPMFGGQLRALHIGRALRLMGDVTLAVVNASDPDRATVEETRSEFTVADPVVARESPDTGLAAKLRRAFDTSYLNVHGVSASGADQERIARLAEKHDLVWVLNSRTPNLLNRWAWPHSHLDIDDVPSTYLRTIASGSPRWSQRQKARVQQRLLQRRERRLLQRFTTLSVCSQDDRRYLGSPDRLHVIPNGFERPATLPRSEPTTPPRLGFIGLFSYAPNLEGVRWFVRECWPAIRQQIPGITLRLVGKETDGVLKPTEPGVEALGFVTDPAREIETWSGMVIPIQSGGGTRIKIAEAFSRKCPVVSTTVGAFGYEVTNGNELLLADSPEAFSRACVDLVHRPRAAAEMAERAWQAFLERWTWDAVAPKVWAAAEDCLRRSRHQPL